jgi:hypothetical protein
MIALNIVLMTAVVVGIVSLLAWAIVSDRRSHRAAGGELSPELAPLTQNLEMPHELRAPHRAGRSHAPRTRRPVTRPTGSTSSTRA